MNALFEEQDEVVAEHARESIVPTSVFEEMVLHHEGFALKELKEVIESVGGKVHTEGHHV